MCLRRRRDRGPGGHGVRVVELGLDRAPAVVLFSRRRIGAGRGQVVHTAVGRMTTTAKPVPMARLLAIAYRQLIDGLHSRLPAAGFDDVRPSYGFVLLAVRDRPTTIVDLAGLLGVTKQAASKLVGAMDAAGYVQRTADASDARAKNIALAPRGI